MAPTNNEVNPCKYLRGLTMQLLVKFMQSDATCFDESALGSLLEPLPELVRVDLRRDFMNLVQVWYNVKIHGKKCSCTSVNRRMSRLELALFRAQDDFADEWARTHRGGAR